MVVVGYFVARNLARPDSWNSVAWYRGAALSDSQQLPMHYGGNSSCTPCHGKEVAVMTRSRHWNLSCESCHGPLDIHADDWRVIGKAIVVTESPSQCLNCHAQQVSKPAGFPQYRYQHGEQETRRHKSQRAGRNCLDCHDAHAPKLHGPWF